MDPHRNEMPDIDIDICQANRHRVINYVRQKYGHVAQIITFGTMKARAVIRDVCRVSNVPLAEANRLARLVPDSAGMTLDKALQAEPELKQAYENNNEIRQVLDICKKLEGLARHVSVHAAGVVVSDKPLTDFVPLYKPPRSEDIVTQYDGATVEKTGLLKMDFLGLKTLSVLEQARQLVRDTHGIHIDLESLDTNDPKVFDLFCSGKTKGIFQFESAGMQDLLVRMKPDRLEDLIAANALYRPGPMVLVDDYIERKHGGQWSLPHPVMSEIMSETHGIMLYQEQVMYIGNRLGDLPLRDAYALIKAIGKKDAQGVAKAKNQFIAGCIVNGLAQKQAEQIFELIERFAGYGFNKSHATRYAFIAYQTAYMKTYWPVEFMAALLTYEIGNIDKVVGYVAECDQMGIKVLPPDINNSGADFTPLYDKGKEAVICFGLAAIKGVGQTAAEHIVATRSELGCFRSLFHFCENIDLQVVNKAAVEALIKAGTFDRLGGSRAQLAARIKKAMKNGDAAAADRKRGQLNFLAQTNQRDYAKDLQYLPDVPPWPEKKMLANEKQVLGFYLTAKPLTKYAEVINTYSTHNSSALKRCGHSQLVVIGGMITDKKSYTIKNGVNVGKKMMVLTLLDLFGQTEVVLFPDILEEYGDCVVKDTIVFVKGKVDHKKEKPTIFADEVVVLEEAGAKLNAKI